MRLTSKQIDELRAYAAERKGELAKLINDAADTIEMLSAKLHAYENPVDMFPDLTDEEKKASREYAQGYADALKDTRQKWIPCSERLPKQNGVYIVTRTISDGFEYGNITDACYFDGSDIWHDDTRVNHGRKHLTDVIAWMPLPEPYRGD